MNALRFLFVLLALPLTAQAQRSWANAAFRDVAGHKYFLHDGATTSARWLWRIGAVQSKGNVVMPSTRSGSATRLSSDTILVSGMSGSSGWLAEVTFSLVGNQVAATVNSIASGNLDVVHLTYLPVASLLVGYDTISRNLVAATYLPGLTLGPWQSIATVSQCPTLSLRSWFVNVEPLDGVVGVQVGGREPYEGSALWDVVRDNSGAWSVSNASLATQSTPLPPTWFVSAYPELTVNSTEYRLWIGGGSGDFVIVDLSTGAPVFVGTHSGSPSGEVFVFPVATLQFGKLYAVESLSGSANVFARSVAFRAESVWPRASVDPQLVPSKVGVRPDFPTVGTDFVSWELHWGSSAPQPVDPLLLTMVVGSWDYGINPTTPALGVEILASQYGTLGVQVATWQNRGYVSFGWAFAVNNPIFVGLKVAMQAVGVLPNGQFIVSDVAGVTLVQ